MKGIGVRIARALADFSQKRAWLVLLVATVVTCLSVWATLHLDLVTDLKRLLPEHAPSVTRLDDLLARAGNQSDIVVSVKSGDHDANVRWGARFAALMEREDSIRFVQFEKPLGELEYSALLYLSASELEEIYDRVTKRFQKEISKEFSLDDDDEELEGGVVKPPSAPVAPGRTTRELDDFEDDEDFGGEAPAKVDEPKGALDDFEDDEDFGGKPAKPDAVETAGSGDRSGDDEDESFNLDDLKRRYGVEEQKRHYTNEDGTLLVIRARPKKDTADTKVCQQLVDMTERHIQAASSSDDPADLEISVAGHHKERTEEVKSLQGDMAISALACVLLLLVVIGIYFRRKRAVLLIAIPLLMSVLWSLGLAWVIYGYLNIISAFIFAVLLGLGIDFGIHVLARYDEARRDGMANPEALREALETTGLSAATGAFTTSVVFFLLTLGDFKGFSQFGMVAGCGVLISLLCVFTVMPALITVFERRKAWRSRDVGTKRALPSWLPDPRGHAALAIALVVFSVSLYAASRSAAHLALEGVAFEYSFNKLGSRSKLRAKEEKARQKEEAKKAAVENGEDDPEAYKSVIGRHSMGAPTIVMPSSLEQAEELYRQFDTMAGLPACLKAALGASDSIEAVRRHPEIVRLLADERIDETLRGDVASGLVEIDRLGKIYPIERLRTMVGRLNEVVSIFKFVPDEQEAKRPVIDRIRKKLLAKKGAMSTEEQADLEELLPYLEPKPISVESLPEWVRVQFREPDGQEGRFLVLRTKGSKSDIKNTGALKGVFFDVMDEHGNKVPAAATYFVLPEIMETIYAEGPLLIGLAIAALFVILLVFFRSIKSMLLVLMPLIFAILWVSGVLAIFEMKLNFYNVIVIPLLMGMGIDHGVHIYSRFREQGGRELTKVLRETGTAIGVATLTTIIGFGGLFFADHIGLNSMGSLAIIGMALAFVAAVVTLPSLLHLDRIRR